MVKGINRQVIVVRPPDQKLFEQAIFLLRPDAQDSCNVTQDELLRQAQQRATARRIFRAGGCAGSLRQDSCGASREAVLWGWRGCSARFSDTQMNQRRFACPMRAGRAPLCVAAGTFFWTSGGFYGIL